MKIVNEKEFFDLIEDEKPTLVDFFATWCGPCKMLMPILEQVEAGSNGKYNIVKVDVDESFDLAKKFGIMSVPTMMIFQNGEEMEKIVGLRQKNQIEEALNNYL